ncbi:MAG TPA: KUP/HAK/KT family potassium transporter [Caulobacteraceae bacterium]|nr:KUP/HAK/KT family potassium transporter [Caulobacteraceae bacterium]
MAAEQTPTSRAGGRSIPAAALTALGIVYGDLGTSPLYTIQTVVEATGGRFTPDGALGVLSLITWTLILTVSIKYCLLVMRADNHGEGGILALMSLVGANRLTGRMRWLTAAGLLGAALIYGDGVITPAISVLSALEGVNVVTTSLVHYVMPLGVVILVGLFAVQHFGTASIGGAFGPVMLVWFLVIGLLGLTGVASHPKCLLALDPRYGIALLAHSGGVGLMILGGVFLCATGGEALYADMGHIGRTPIRLSWYFLVLPSLLLSYAGQTGLLLDKPHFAGNPFFLLAPSWAVYPLVALATLATIIASQAIITGSFSMTRQAMQLGWLPGVQIRQTSDSVYGQIYVPVVNGLMMIATVGIAIGFGSSARLAGAFGTAVSTTMLMTTALLFTAMVRIWRWPLLASIPIATLFITVDAAYFGANLLKIVDGGWLPLTLGGTLFFVMATWRMGVDGVRGATAAQAEPAPLFLKELEKAKIPRTPGCAIFLSRFDIDMPSIVVDYVRSVGALHESVVIVTVEFVEIPRVAESERSQVALVGANIWRVSLRFGFIEIPDLPAKLAAVTALKGKADIQSAVYFGARDMVVGKPHGRLVGWRLYVFAWLYRNAVKVVDRFNLPPTNVIELARQLQI